MKNSISNVNSVIKAQPVGSIPVAKAKEELAELKALMIQGNLTKEQSTRINNFISHVHAEVKSLAIEIYNEYSVGYLRSLKLNNTDLKIVVKYLEIFSSKSDKADICKIHIDSLGKNSFPIDNAIINKQLEQSLLKLKDVQTICSLTKLIFSKYKTIHQSIVTSLINKLPLGKQKEDQDILNLILNNLT